MKNIQSRFLPGFDSSFETVLEIIRTYGDIPLAGQLTQPRLNIFQYRNSFLAHRRHRRKVYVLGDPLGPSEEKLEVILRFLEQGKNCSFIQIHYETARILAELGYYINSFGVERTLHLPYQRSGKEKAWVRNLYNAGLRNQIFVREIPVAYVQHPDRTHIRPGSNQKHNRLRKEFSFLARTGVTHLPNGSRIFGGFVDGVLIGYSVFDPLYKNGEIIGYSEVVPKRSSSAPKGTRVYILLKAMEEFAREGKQKISLGLSPLEAIEKYDIETGFADSKLTRFMLKTLRNSGGNFFNFKGLSFHKSRFGGETEPVYCAFKTLLPIDGLLGIYQLTTNYSLPPWLGLI